MIYFSHFLKVYLEMQSGRNIFRKYVNISVGIQYIMISFHFIFYEMTLFMIVMMMNWFSKTLFALIYNIRLNYFDFELAINPSRPLIQTKIWKCHFFLLNENTYILDLPRSIPLCYSRYNISLLTRPPNNWVFDG